MIHPIIEKALKEETPKSIFEVGCGMGTFFEDYNVKLGGIDISKEDLQKSDNFILFDATQPNWPVPDKSYDIVISIGTLILFPEVVVPLKEMMRIAKDKVIIAEFHDETLEVDELRDRYYWRNYRKVFDSLNFFHRFCGYEKDKAIFKCKV